MTVLGAPDCLCRSRPYKTQDRHCGQGAPARPYRAEVGRWGMGGGWRGREVEETARTQGEEE